MTGRRIRLTLTGARVVDKAGKKTLRTLTVNMARRMGHWLMTPVNILFPQVAGAEQLRLTPGDAAELEIAIRAPGCHHVHVFSESSTVTGAAALDLSPPQAVVLDDMGYGTAIIRATPEDDRNTGLARIRIAAVDPEQPDIVAAEIGDTRVSIPGTGFIVNMVLAVAILAGVTLELFAKSLPFIGVLILIALGFAWINAPRGSGISFRPMMLLPFKRRLAAAGGIIGGFAGWYVLMSLNLDGDGAVSPYCGEPGQDDCSFADTLIDNLTSIGAATVLFALIFIVLSPAFRPRRIAGYAFALSAAIPLMVYDFTLLGSAVSDPYLFGVTKALTYGYSVFGWGLAALALVGLALHQRAGLGRLGMIAILTGIIAVPAAVAASRMSVSGLLEDSELFYTFIPAALDVAAVVFPVLAALAARFVLTPFPNWRWLRTGLFALVMTGASLMLFKENEDDPLVIGMVLVVFAVVWTFAEITLWQRGRKPARAARRVGAAVDTSPEGEEGSLDEASPVNP